MIYTFSTYWCWFPEAFGLGRLLGTDKFIKTREGAMETIPHFKIFPIISFLFLTGLNIELPGTSISQDTFRVLYQNGFLPKNMSCR